MHCVWSWAKPWGYREENHSYSFSILSLHNIEFHLPIQDGKARLGRRLLT